MVAKNVRRPKSQFSDELLSHQLPLKYFLLSLVGSIHDAEEILQETLKIAWEKQESYTPGTNMKAWVFEIARRQAMAFHRAQSREKGFTPIDESVLESIASSVSHVDQGDLERDREYLSQCLEKLTSSYRKLVLARYFQGRNVSELAQEEDLEPNAMSQKLFRIRRKLAICIEKKRLNHSPD